MDTHVSLTSQAMVYVLAVVIVAYSQSWVASVLCAVGAVTALNFFFVPPRWTFAVDSREHLIALGVMLLVALVISRLASALRIQTVAALRHAQRAQQLQELATRLAEAPDIPAVVRLGHAAFDTAFAAPHVLAVVDADGQLPVQPDWPDLTRDGLQCCIRESAVLGPGTGRWPGLNAWFLPLGVRGQVCGAACVYSAQPETMAADTAGRLHAQALATLLGQTLTRLRLHASAEASHRAAQHQHMQNMFLAAISHDLRTPLAALMGGATALLTQRDRLQPAEQDRLLRSLVDESAYLSAVTENTLQLVRLQNTTQDIRRSWESLEEIVGAVLARVRASAPHRTVQAKVAQGLPLVWGDAVLLSQLIANLLDNALKYSDGPVNLDVHATDSALRLLVKDRGPGISPEQLETVFTPYARGDHAQTRGAGLGLALCKAIADAHHAHIAVRARQGGGATFTVTWPVQTQPEFGAHP